MANFFAQFHDAPADTAGGDNFFAQFHQAPETDAQPQEVNTVADVAKAAGSGLVKGGAGIVGLPADLASIAALAIDPVARMTGASPEQIAESKRRAAGLPTSDKVLGGIENATGFKPYEAQTKAGKFAGTVAEFVPGAVIGGPTKEGASFVANAARNAIKYGAVPGALSEAAGQATEGTPFEPVARAATAVLTGGVLAVRDVLKERSAAARAIPSTEAIREAGSALYNASEKQGVVLAPKPLTQAITDIGSAVRTEGLDKDLTPKAFAALNRLEELKGASPTLKEVDTVRKVINIALKSDVPADTHMAHMMIDGLDSYLNKIQPGQVLSAGNPQAAVSMLRAARTNWATQSKSAIIDGIMERAQSRAGQFSQSGMDNAVRTEFRQLAMNPKRIARFTQPEQQAIRYVAQGGKLQNAMRMIGKFAPHGLHSAAITGGLGALAGGPVGAAAALAGTEAARAVATKMTKDAAARVSAIVRNGGHLPAQLQAGLPTALAKRVTRSSAIETENANRK